MNSMVPPSVVIGRVLLCSRTGWIMLDWFRTLHLGLALDSAEYLVNRKLHWDEVIVCLENSELAVRGVRVYQLVGVIPWLCP